MIERAKNYIITTRRPFERSRLAVYDCMTALLVGPGLGINYPIKLNVGR